jgi:hypothetical protein
VWPFALPPAPIEIARSLVALGRPYGIYNGAGPTAAGARFFFGFYGWKTGASQIGPWVYSFGESVFTGNGLRQEDEGYVYHASDGPLPSVMWEAVREVVDDYRYVHLLWRMIGAVQTSEKPGARLAAAEAERALTRILSQIGWGFQAMESGDPVFWLGTTQWQLFREYKLEDARTIIERTKARGFAFAQVMLLGVGDGTKPNVYGEKPWLDDNPQTPNEGYFKHVDAVVQIARQNNLVISMTMFHQRLVALGATDDVLSCRGGREKPSGSALDQRRSRSGPSRLSDVHPCGAQTEMVWPSGLDRLGTFRPAATCSNKAGRC